MTPTDRAGVQLRAFNDAGGYKHSRLKNTPRIPGKRRNKLNRPYDLLIASLLVLVGSNAIAAPSTTAPAVYGTPAAVLAASTKASGENDFATVVDCLTPRIWDQIVRFALVSNTLESDDTDDDGNPTSHPSTNSADSWKKAFVEKYGLADRKMHPGETFPQFMQRRADQIKDKRAFLVDLLTQEAAHAPPTGRIQTSFTLSDVQIDQTGKTATGKVLAQTPGYKDVPLDIHFEKIGGSWKLDSSLGPMALVKS